MIRQQLKLINIGKQAADLLCFSDCGTIKDVARELCLPPDFTKRAIRAYQQDALARFVAEEVASFKN